MDDPQNSPNTVMANSTETKTLGLLSLKQEEWVSYCAVGGLITTEDGAIRKMSISDFAIQLGVDRKTLTNWKTSIPNFWERVDARRRELFSRSRIAVVWNGLFLRAAKGDAEQAKIILSHYADWQPPSQKHEVQIGGLIDLARLAEQENVIEGETVDESKQ